MNLMIVVVTVKMLMVLRIVGTFIVVEGVMGVAVARMLMVIRMALLRSFVRGMRMTTQSVRMTCMVMMPMVVVRVTRVVVAVVLVGMRMTCKLVVMTVIMVMIMSVRMTVVVVVVMIVRMPVTMVMIVMVMMIVMVVTSVLFLGLCKVSISCAFALHLDDQFTSTDGASKRFAGLEPSTGTHGWRSQLPGPPRHIENILIGGLVLDKHLQSRHKCRMLGGSTCARTAHQTASATGKDRRGPFRG